MTEAELCARFAEIARDQGWTAYPEVDGWDLVLVWDGPNRARATAGFQPSRSRRKRLTYRMEVYPGEQLAVEAKVGAHADALAQAHRRVTSGRTKDGRAGPEFAGVVVPAAGWATRYVARRMDLECFSVRRCRPDQRGLVRPVLPEKAHRRPRAAHERLWTPPVVPDVDAGVPSPAAVTPWRMAALKICAVLRTRGYVTSQDFDRVGISKKTWRRAGWIEHRGEKHDRLHKYRPCFGADNFPDEGWRETQRRLLEEDPEGVPDALVKQYLAEHS